MVDKTTNYNLNKPTPEDFYNIQDFNENADIIDTELKRLSDVPAPSKEAVGLGNVDNVKQASKEEFDVLATSLDEHQAENATTSKKGHVQLSTSTTSTSTTLAATPSAVRLAMNRANEAFTSASNGKTLVGSAITGVDGSVVIPTDPTFNDLASAIGGISTGKKWASGSTRVNGGTVLSLSVTGLSFRPSYVMAYSTSASEGVKISIIADGYNYYSARNQNWSSNAGVGGYIHELQKDTANVGSAGFSLTVIKLASYLNPIPGDTINWIAFE